jgi:two-component sensor histidine kinase
MDTLVNERPRTVRSLADARLSEAHHRIANNLTMIASFVRLEASGLGKRSAMLSPAEARAMLAGVEARIETVARLHRLLSLSSAHQPIDLGDYLASTCEVLSQSVAFDGDTILRCRADACETDPDRAALIGLIINELVINAVKYAHPAGAPGRIEVGCAVARSGQLVIRVADDGVGLPEGFAPASDGGLGLRIVWSLTRQLGAKVDFRSSALGLEVRLTIPPQTPGRTGPETWQ